MGEFFQGWRRKTGLALLALALLLMGVWVRSTVVEDQLAINWLGRLHWFHSFNGTVAWKQYTPWIQAKSFVLYERESPPTDHTDHWDNDDDDVDWSWKWRACEFEFRAGTFSKPFWGDIRLRIIPYWSLVLPLTLLSAFLIISKPKQPKSAKEPKRA